MTLVKYRTAIRIAMTTRMALSALPMFFFMIVQLGVKIKGYGVNIDLVQTVTSDSSQQERIKLYLYLPEHHRYIGKAGPKVP
jgi:hypothetical protein